MGVCETCKHWADDRYEYVSLARRSVRQCNYVLQFFECRGWNEQGEDVLTSDRKAFAQDGSDYAASLMTMADFGCNQWEAK